nr:guanine nucleotide exchange factor [Hymenolepis microstoma]
MTTPSESAETPTQVEECTALQTIEPICGRAEGVVSSCIIAQSPPTEKVNTTTTISTITDPNGRVKKLKTTTTTTLRTTTTVRRVCVVAPGSTTVSVPPEGESAIHEGTSVFQGTPALPPVPAEGALQATPTGSECVRLTHVSGDDGDSKKPMNITQVTFMKPQTQTSEVVEVHTNDKSPETDSNAGTSQGKTTTKTVRKRVTTSVSAVFASRHTKVDRKSVAGDAVTRSKQVSGEDSGTIFDASTDFPNEDSAAMTALRECERQFATRLDRAKNSASDGSSTIVDHFTSQNGKTTTTTTTKTTTLKGSAFPSLFDGLPLYQGYGMISQRAKDIDPSDTPISIFFNGSLDQIDVASLTKMFEDTTRTSLLSNDLHSLFGDMTIPPKPIEGSGVVIEEVTDDDKGESDAAEPTDSESASRKTSAHSISSESSAPVTPITKDGETVGYKNQILNQLAAKTGPCRIAWSEMPEVLTGNIVSTMTRHEIQLQEAMFEVITSEASYYRSLQVLIEHFYSAPEFDCSKSAPTTADNNSSIFADNDPESAVPPSNESRQSSTGINARAGSITSTADLGAPVVKTVLSPTEKHHLFSNVLLICMASERFLKDLEERWSSQKPLLSEVCDLIVKHAGSVQFDPYLTYLRNQTYQVAAYRRLNLREDFQKAIARMHAHPEVGKNRLDSFLALPMQRLTRLKLLVEVIQKLQSLVAMDAEKRAVAGSTETMTPGVCDSSRRMKITKQQIENSSIALRELKRLLSESESEKKLMDEKARLLELSSALEFPENVKRIAISDKRLVKEGELRSANSDGKAAVLLKKLGRKKPETFYLILFQDLLMVTKLKKNDRYLVQDYCPHDKVYVTIGNPTEAALNLLGAYIPRSQTMSTPDGGIPGSKRQKRPSTSLLGLRGGPRHHTTTPDVPEALFKSSGTDTRPAHPSPPTSTSLSSMQSSSSSMEACGPAGSPMSPSRLASVRLKRSGSSLSSKSVPSGSSYAFPSSSINRDPPLFLYLFLTESQSGCCTEFCLTTNDSAEYESWYRALQSKSLKLNVANTEQKAPNQEAHS